MQDISKDPQIGQKLLNKALIYTISACVHLQQLQAENPSTVFYIPYNFSFFARLLFNNQNFAVGCNLVELQDNQQIEQFVAKQLDFLDTKTDSVLTDESQIELFPLQFKQIQYNISNLSEFIEIMKHYNGKRLAVTQNVKLMWTSLAQLKNEFLKTSDLIEFVSAEELSKQDVADNCLDISILPYSIDYQEGLSLIINDAQKQQITQVMKKRDVFFTSVYNKFPQRPDWFRDIKFEEGNYVVEELNEK